MAGDTVQDMLWKRMYGKMDLVVALCIVAIAKDQGTMEVVIEQMRLVAKKAAREEIFLANIQEVISPSVKIAIQVLKEM